MKKLIFFLALLLPSIAFSQSYDFTDIETAVESLDSKLTDPMSIDDGGGSLTVDGTLTCLPSGTQDVGIVSDSVGLATSANQSTIITHLLSLLGVDFATDTELQGKLEEATFTARIGEVQATPTTYTVLHRLKAIADAISTSANDVKTIMTNTTPSTGIGSGSTTVTTAGTAVPLSSSTSIREVIVQAKRANTGVIYVGGSSVDSTRGRVLVPGQASEIISIDNLSKVYVDADNNGEGVTWYFTAK